MKVLVTGGTGFTGGRMCKMLVEKGVAVKALVRKSSNTEKLEKMGVELVYGDLAGSLEITDQLMDVQTVFHVAAAYRQEGVAKDFFWQVNVEGTGQLLEQANAAGVKRFVHCSTVGVQGEIDNPPAKEDAPYKPGDHYQESKMEGEILALKFFENHANMHGVVVRPVGIYGPGDTRFLKLFKSLNKGTFRMIGTGNILYHWTFVDDLCRGIMLAGEQDVPSGSVYTIGGNEFMTLKGIVEKIAQAVGRPVPKFHIPVLPVYIASALCEAICRPLKIEPPLYRRRLDFFTKDRAFDITKAKTELGYNPQVNIDEGIRITANWYRDNGWLTK